jgi:isoamylase
MLTKPSSVLARYRVSPDVTPLPTCSRKTRQDGSVQIWPGQWRPLGATPDDEGTNFALFSGSAEDVELCLFDDAGAETRVPLTQQTCHVWHGYLPGVQPGTRYGFRVDGPFDPARGMRFNPSKLLVDPYARAIDGTFTPDDAVFGYPRDRDDMAQDHRDSAPFVPRSIVVRDRFDWADDAAPNTPWADTVIYELHVRGFTKQHPKIPPELRGTYAGLAHPAALEHLTSLGVTAVELMPVHHFVSEPALSRRGLSNYWGYNTLGFFAPHAAYSSSGTGGEQVGEFKAMVAALHAAGLEVILDVVYNHTAESDELGPTLSFRGIDNSAYYRLRNGRFYVNYTGTGNTLDVPQPFVLQLITDSLRYWVTEMHVDGFRFDLAPALARSTHAVEKMSSFFAAIHQDPVLSGVKLIAEPWDVGEGGYQVGAFPPPWSEWNDHFRDSVRDFWLRGMTGVRELGYRLAGSSDLYQEPGRRAYASINYVSCHDGFSLHDLVAYDDKHNEANGEHNRDGSSDSHNWNCGHEGETDDPVVIGLRQRAVRGLLSTLLLSTGVPMLGHGDELGRTQRGNNNAYCQDNELTWIDWSAADTALLGFTRRLIALRKAHPVFRQQSFFTGTAMHGNGVKDVAWFRSDGEQMSSSAWYDTRTRTIGMYLSGSEMRLVGSRGEPIVDDSFLIVLHAGLDNTSFTLPGEPWASHYEIVLDSSGEHESEKVVAGAACELPALSLLVFRVQARALAQVAGDHSFTQRRQRDQP